MPPSSSTTRICTQTPAGAIATSVATLEPGNTMAARQPPRADAPSSNEPPWASATAVTMASPRPVPSRSARPSRPNRSTTLSRSSSGIPGPESSMEMTSEPVPTAERGADLDGVAGRRGLDSVVDQVEHGTAQLGYIHVEHQVGHGSDTEAAVGEHLGPPPRDRRGRSGGPGAPTGGSRARGPAPRAGGARPVPPCDRALRSPRRPFHGPRPRWRSAVGPGPRGGHGQPSSVCAADGTRRTAAVAGRPWPPGADRASSRTLRPAVPPRRRCPGPRGAGPGRPLRWTRPWW